MKCRSSDLQDITVDNIFRVILKLLLGNAHIHVHAWQLKRDPPYSSDSTAGGSGVKLLPISTFTLKWALWQVSAKHIEQLVVAGDHTSFYFIFTFHVVMVTRRTYKIIK